MPRLGAAGNVVRVGFGAIVAAAFVSQPAPVAGKLNDVPAFSVIWNGPSSSCNKGSHPLDLASYGLVVNANQSFIGSAVACFYHIGLFPKLHGELNGSACWQKTRPCTGHPWGQINVTQNGGVPQAADIEAHIVAVKSDVEKQLPDKDFSGILVVDYEAWRPLYSECYDSLSLYREYSMRLVRSDPNFSASGNSTAVEEEAKRRFNEGAKTFFTATVAAIRSVRPRAQVGFYSQGIDGSNTTRGMASNQALQWLWEVVDVLCPSIYPRSLNATAEAERAASFVAGAIASAQMVTSRPRPAVMPYGRALMTAKKPAQPFTPGILAAQIQVAAGMGAEGVVLWGASSDYHANGCETIERELTNFAGRTIQTCISNRAACAMAHCNNHGRCVDYEPDRLLDTCVKASPTIRCRCNDGYGGDDCSSSLGLAGSV